MSSMSYDSDSDGTITEEPVGPSARLETLAAIQNGGGEVRVKRNIELDMVAPLGVFTEVELTNVKDANHMYLRWGDSFVATNVDVSPKELSKIRLAVLENIKVNDYCLVNYGGDERNGRGLHRACVLQVPDSQDAAACCQVLLVDNGVELSVPRDQIYLIPDIYMNQRRLCFKFGLLRYAQVQSEEAFTMSKDRLYQIFKENRIFVQIKATAYNENKEATRQLGELGVNRRGQDEVVVAMNVYKKLLEDGCIVDYVMRDFLKMDRESIVPTLVRPRVKERERLSMVRAEKVWIDPDVESLNDFYVIKSSLMGRKAEIDGIIERMDTVGLDSYAPWEENIGEWCLARKSHGRSHDWFRARVITISGAEAKVELLDSGGVQVTNLRELKNMPFVVRDTASLGIRCSLPLQPVREEYSSVIINNFKNLNNLEVDVLAHMIGHVGGFHLEVDLEIRNFHYEKFSFSKRLVENGEAVWTNLDYAANRVDKIISMDSETSGTSETGSNCSASVYELSENSETASVTSTVSESADEEYVT